jgi:molybdenum transport protein
MNHFSDQELWEYIREDIPYFDLTTHLLAPAPQKAILSITTRDAIVMACGDAAARMAELLGCEVKFKAESGSLLGKNGLLLEIEGDAKSLHKAWRVCQVFLEYACALATNAHQMLEQVRSVNPHCEVLVTRKSFPFAKRFCVSALMVGGVMPHRLGLSETILIFNHHRVMYENKEAFERALLELKKRCVEKKLVVESQTLEDAKRMLQLGADVLQLDKCNIEIIGEIVRYKNENFPHAKITAAGGVNMKNAAHFAETGVDAVVTSSLYKAGMSDLTSSWRVV